MRIRSLRVLCVVCALCIHGPAGQAQSGIRIGVLNGTTYAVTTVSLETYVARVLAGEAAPGTAPAALQALAIAVRTYTAANLRRHQDEGFDLCDQTHCQVMRVANPDTEKASLATAGQVLLDHGSPATIYYSASCGGRTELPSAVWPGSPDPPHLPSRADDGCGGMPVWSAELTARDLERSLVAGGYRGTLKNVRILSRNGSGRVATLALDGMTPAEISGQDLRMVVGPILGWRMILSTAFELRRRGDVYRMTGRGSGHGVGMCVIGSMKLAEAGESAHAILERYYPGLIIGPFVPPADLPPRVAPAPTRSPLTIVLPGADEGERAALTALVSRARDDLSRTLGVPPPGRLALTFHATVTDYERATGQVSFTSTVERDGTLHVLPLGVLRSRGMLERTVRRALARAMTASVLDGRRAWVREGAALYFSDPPTGPARVEPRAPCPSDADLDRPVSAGALTEAYARARACFAREVSSGRRWQDVR